MSIRSHRQLEHTRQKLQVLEARVRAIEVEPTLKPPAREATVRSLKKLINQFKEEIARFESRSSVRSDRA